MSPETEQTDLLRVYDTSGRLYICSFNDCLGRGGQGQVLRARGDRYTAVKIACHNDIPIQDNASIKSYQHQIKRIRALPVPASLRLSMPTAVLKDKAGYVMLLLGKMTSLKRIIPSMWKEDDLREIDIPDWLAKADELFAHQLALYARTGGLRIRLDILRQIAAILARLHANGLVFGDLSHNNVQISGEGEREAWLIDVDNLCYDGSGEIVYTPGYCAPEVYREEKGVSQASDAYAFALMAFELLSMLHPFHAGRIVDDDGWDNDAQTEADSGNLPWICDTEDKSNHQEMRSPLLDYVMTKPLLALFQQMFSNGRNKLYERPPLWMWHVALAWSQDLTVTCPACGMGWVTVEHNEPDCPFCHTALPLILEGCAGENRLFAHEVPTTGEFFMSRRLFAPSKLASDKPLLKIRRDGEKAELSILDDQVRLSCATANETLHPCPAIMECSLDTLRGGIRFLLEAPGAWEIILREGRGHD